MNAQVLLSVRNYTQRFPIREGLTIHAVNGVSFDVRQGEIFGLVGESGCGKSTLARAVMGIVTPTEGEILFKGYSISDKRSYRAHQKDIQRGIQVIFQDSASALNPRMRVEDIVAEPFVINRLFRSKPSLRAEVEKLLTLVGLDTAYARKLPGELSGGQRQRVAIARGIALNPELLVADEPVASLDVSIQAQIITLFQHLQEQHGFTFLFIAHDLAMVRFLCDRVGVMRAGKLVELAPTAELFERPLHPYTRSLIAAMPVPDPVFERSKQILPCPPPETSSPKQRWTPYGPGHFVLEDAAE